MDIRGIHVSAPSANSGQGGGRPFFTLQSAAQPESFRLPDGNAGIPLDRETGKAIPLKRERGPVALRPTDDNAAIEAKKAKLRKAAEGFEAIFVRQLLKTMRSTVPGNSLYGSGATGDMYADMVESSLADAMSKQGKFGIADTLYSQMVRRIDSQEANRVIASPQVSPQDEGR